MALRALARVNVAAIERNCARLRGALRSGAELCAVVKADGYGHGAPASARAAVAGGATWLAVATAGEARALATARLPTRLLVMGALSDEELDDALAARAELVAWRVRWLERLAARVRYRGAPAVRIHVKLDTGMGRLGTRDPAEAARIVALAAGAPELELAGLMTHFATADERGDAFLGEQLGRFAAWVQDVRREHPALVAHAANSAATLREPASHFDLVRCGIAIYGLDPYGEDPDLRGLEPALELRSYVADVKPCAPGQSAGYGRRFIARRHTHVAVLPIGYADGVRRGLTNNADVLVAGRRLPLVGTVSMDNVTLDAGAPPVAAPGNPAVLIGRQGAERVTAEELARRLGTINYEVTCAISARVPRAHHRDGRSA